MSTFRELLDIHWQYQKYVEVIIYISYAYPFQGEKTPTHVTINQ